jgi:Rhodopirellula transposase DDE domain
MARAQDDGRGPQAQGIAAAPSGESQTTKAEGRDRRPVRHYGKKEHAAGPADNVKRLRIDGKATGRSGAGSRGGLTRGDPQACAHDLGGHAKDSPWGIGEEDGGHLPLTFGRASKTSDGIVEAREAWGAAWDETEHVALARLQSQMENGPASRGKRPQFWPRMGAVCEAIGQPMQRLSSPPSHSQDQPIERCWGLWALPGNGPKWVDGETRVEWANTLTWKGMHPIVALRRKVSQKGVALSQRAMQAVEARLARHPALPTWDILILPAAL